MRCLGIPNTKHFHDITLIEDVQALYSRIKENLATGQFVIDLHEEYEGVLILHSLVIL
jgi:splicing factor 3A subunit 3